MRVGADGRPADETRLSETTCAELDALAEGRRGKELACIGRTAIACGPRGTEVTLAVDVLAHESFHLRGIIDEAETECRSLQAMAWTASGSAPRPSRAARWRPPSTRACTSGCPRPTGPAPVPRAARSTSAPDDPRFP